MPRIQQLSPSVVNKIAAGEVIERPASVVKELVENAIDAGARRIDVAVDRGGVEVIRVTDDGCGIAADELALALTSHATSKIREADDLFHVRTLGFRGEALASIAEVSRLLLRSRTADDPAGAEIEVVAGQRTGPTPCGCPQGTTIEVSSLFCNTPVRRKFLRSTQTEFGHLTEAFLRQVLAYPEIHFTLRHHDRTVYDLPATDQWTDRIAAVLGPELVAGLIPVESVDEQVRLWGYVAHPSHSRSHAKMQYLFLNGRHIRDRSLQHALGEAYRGLLLTGRYPISILQMTMPPEMVDVNVHPTKLEVRFLDSGRIYSQLLSTLRTRFLSADLSTQLRPPETEQPGDAAHDPAQAERFREQVIQWAQGGSAAASRMVQVEPRRPLTLNRIDDAAAWRQSSTPAARSGQGASPAQGEHAPTIVPAAVGFAELEATVAGDLPTSLDPAHDVAVPAMQVHNRYLVVEEDQGIVVIDQHALHERILYEQFRARLDSGTLESQMLLVPEPVDLGPSQAARLLEHRDELARLGVKVEPFGGGTVLVTGHPAMLAASPVAEVLRSLVTQLESGAHRPQMGDLVDELLHMMACKAAVKAGDRLSAEEIQALLAQRHLVHDTHHCPHGRPTALVLSREELDKQFKRT
ncbi:MAG: DNA mismatch repair endonuclease MutL [Pirellulales bacterium]|nr:DNA mismatch repair endonuclease MutL [Pirellulales bacterium]